MRMLILGLVLVAGVRGQSLTNLLQNGSFEVPALAGTMNVSGAFSLAGWSGVMPSNGGNGGLVVGTDNGLAPQEGAQHFTFNGGNPSDRGWLEQSFATVAGRSYVIDFWVGRAGGGQALSLELAALDGASVLASGSFSPPDGRSYASASMSFVAAGATSVIRFTDTSGGNSISDLYLDNVSVSAIPEPAAWGAMVGVVALGLAAGRQRRG